MLCMLCMSVIQEKMSSKTDCQDVIKTLLYAYNKYSTSKPCIVIREHLNASHECNHVVDLASMKSKYKEFVGPDSISRIHDFNESYNDDKKALQATMHFNTHNKRQLEDKLTWINWIAYKTNPSY